MLGSIIKRHRAVEMCSAFCDTTRRCQGYTHEAMPHHEWDRSSLFLGKRHELRRKLAHHLAVERHVVRDPEAVEDSEQQKRIFRALSERFSLFDQQTCPLLSRLGFRRRIPLDMDERSYERDLKLDLFAAQRRRGGQGRNLGKRTSKLLCGFDQCRARQ
jgi:hypothetical protein